MAASILRSISDALANEIEHMEPGQKVASEHEIMARFSVSRTAARNVVADLEARFLVRRVRGAGTFVNDRIDYVISNSLPPSMHSTVAAAGGEIKTFLLDAGKQALPEDIAALLETPVSTTATRLSRLGYINGAVSSFSDEWLAPGIAEHIDVGLGVIESVHDILRAYRHAPRRAWSRATMASPPADIEKRLELAAPVPTWIVDTVTRDADTDGVLMASRTWTRQDTVRMVFEFELGEG